jgi:hypothetical protein
MARLLAPQTPLAELPVFFNVDDVVGAGPAQNRREDVLLVQMALKQIGDSPKQDADANLVAACKAVQMKGTMDDATTKAIRLVQEQARKDQPSTIVDGRVSPARGAYSYGAGYWTIVVLNIAIRTRNLNTWPRIDKIAGCPNELQQMVNRTLAGVG